MNKMLFPDFQTIISPSMLVGWKCYECSQLSRKNPSHRSGIDVQVNAQNVNGVSTLHRAIIDPKYQLVKLLFKHGACVSIKVHLL